MTEFPRFLQIPVAGWIDSIVSWIVANLGSVLDAIGDVLLAVLVAIEHALLWIPWFVILIAVAFVAWYAIRKWWAAPLMASFLILIGTFGYWDLAMMTLALILAAVLLSLLIGIPTGIVTARSDRFANVLRPVLDAMQTMPSFVYLIPALMFFGLGKVPAVFATVIYAVPPVIRLTNVGIRGVPSSVIEAAQAFGASSRQILMEVQLPLAFPSIMVGVNQTTMMALAMVVISSMIGARGLGMEVLLAINRIEVGRGFEAGLSIVLLAILIDRVTHAFAARQQHGNPGA